MIRRRDFITLLGGTAAWPFAARAQQSAMPVIGWLSVASADGMLARLSDFREGLKQQGFVEHQNVLIEYRWANEQSELLQRLAVELISRRVSVIAVGGGTVTALAAKASTAAIPIVFAIAADPVRAGLVESLGRPGGNITGIVGFTDQLITKRLEVVGQLLPNASVIGALLNPSNPNSQRRASDLRAAAAMIGRQIFIVQANHSDEL